MPHTMLDPQPKSWIFVHADLNSVTDISRMKFLEWKWILLFLLMVALFQTAEGRRRGGCRRYGRRQRHRSVSNGQTTLGDLLSALRPSMKPSMKSPTFNQDQKMHKFNKKYALYASGKPMTKKPYKQAKKEHSATKKFLLTNKQQRGIRKGGCRPYGGRRNRNRSIWTPKLWRFYNGRTTPGDLLSALRPTMRPNKPKMKLSTFDQDQKMQKFHKKYASSKPMTKKPYKQSKKKHSATKKLLLKNKQQ
ncbi:hypothetical protein CDAR_234521 [Caerostris darwini]|uniref:Uncharacterized protein n=1 Tax=Caerostris darwini TaxID=1538125 RepID=A0AAV4THY0_9ARAC|nr:hypothetical protein CDAR_234521 [Caerostris darwini]